MSLSVKPEPSVLSVTCRHERRCLVTLAVRCGHVGSLNILNQQRLVALEHAAADALAHTHESAAHDLWVHAARRGNAQSPRLLVVDHDGGLLHAQDVDDLVENNLVDVVEIVRARDGTA
jgi:hypothetical protein